MARYYVVWKGRRPGIYDSWEACKAQVDGFPNARFKAFPTLNIARRALELGPRAAELPTWFLAEPGPEVPSVAVDAAASQAHGPVLYRGVVLLPEGHTKLLFEGQLPEATVNAGEFVALVEALCRLHEQGCVLPVYTDSRVALTWYQKGGPPEKVRRAWSEALRRAVEDAAAWLAAHPGPWDVRFWDTPNWGENPADFGHK